VGSTVINRQICFFITVPGSKPRLLPIKIELTPEQLNILAEKIADLIVDKMNVIYSERQIVVENPPEWYSEADSNQSLPEAASAIPQGAGNATPSAITTSSNVTAVVTSSISTYALQDYTNQLHIRQTSDDIVAPQVPIWVSSNTINTNVISPVDAANLSNPIGWNSRFSTINSTIQQNNELYNSGSTNVVPTPLTFLSGIDQSAMTALSSQGTGSLIKIDTGALTSTVIGMLGNIPDSSQVPTFMIGASLQIGKDGSILLNNPAKDTEHLLAGFSALGGASIVYSEASMGIIGGSVTTPSTMYIGADGLVKIDGAVLKVDYQQASNNIGPIGAIFNQLNATGQNISTSYGLQLPSVTSNAISPSWLCRPDNRIEVTPGNDLGQVNLSTTCSFTQPVTIPNTLLQNQTDTTIIH
jgi:hypothetical protein